MLEEVVLLTSAQKSDHETLGPKDLKKERGRFLELETEREKFEVRFSSYYTSDLITLTLSLAWLYSENQEQRRCGRILETPSLGAHIYLSLQTKLMQMKQV